MFALEWFNGRQSCQPGTLHWFVTNGFHLWLATINILNIFLEFRFSKFHCDTNFYNIDELNVCTNNCEKSKWFLTSAKLQISIYTCEGELIFSNSYNEGAENWKFQVTLLSVGHRQGFVWILSVVYFPLQYRPCMCSVWSKTHV